MLKYILFLFFVTSLFSIEPQAEQETTQESRNYTPKVECLVLEDENSILCKFEIIITPRYWKKSSSYPLSMKKKTLKPL